MLLQVAFIGAFSIHWSQILPFMPVKRIFTSLSARSQKEHFLSVCFGIIAIV
jgi:hypothetical protein